MINKYKVNCMFIITNINCPMFLFGEVMYRYITDICVKVGLLTEILRRVFCFLAMQLLRR